MVNSSEQANQILSTITDSQWRALGNAHQFKLLYLSDKEAYLKLKKGKR